MSAFMTQARPYARALYEIAQQEKAIAAWRQVLPVLAMVMQNKQALRYVNAPTTSSDDVVALLIAVQANLSASQQNLLRLLAKQGQLKLLPAITEAFEKIALAENNTAHVEISSAQVLTAAQQEKLATMLQQKLQKKVDIHYTVSPELIGGVVIKTEAGVIDNSVQHQLAQLRKIVMG